MLVTRASLRWKIYRHLEAWIGLLVCVVLAATCSIVRAASGHAVMAAAFGGMILGAIQRRVLIHVAQRYYQSILFKSVR